MLTIRLSRIGKKKHPIFRVIVSEKLKDTVGDYLELLGHYNPHTNTAELKAERIKYWISKGAQTSGTVHNLLVENKIISGKKIKVANIKKKKKEEDSEEKATAEKPTEQKDSEVNSGEDKEKSEKEEKPAEKKEEPKNKTKEDNSASGEK